MAENHHQQLVPAGKVTDPKIAIEGGDVAIKDSGWQELNNLSEYILA